MDEDDNEWIDHQESIALIDIYGWKYGGDRIHYPVRIINEENIGRDIYEVEYISNIYSTSFLKLYIYLKKLELVGKI